MLGLYLKYGNNYGRRRKIVYPNKETFFLPYSNQHPRIVYNSIWLHYHNVYINVFSIHSRNKKTANIPKYYINQNIPYVLDFQTTQIVII